MMDVTDHLALVNFVIKRHFASNLNDYEYDDLFQIGCMGLIRAGNSFDNSRGEFSTFAYKSIYREILFFIIRQKNKRRNFLHLDFFKETIPDDKDYFNNVENKIIVKELLEKLTDLERKYVEENFFNGLKQTEIAFKYNKSRQSVSQVINYSIEKLRREVI
ncbi:MULTISPECIES: sigma-70 family RNA polymerase sigma factor [Clostridium]|nr:MULTISPECIES: sigma-70 family RNA polymerase sigma factor [Clostridium]